ncbi:condensin-2 complex subunit H2 isoform X2 [Phaenicophaeus curvirostris]|uniref:condensin-2 complex subunit H2 isoform X2 n=1 Tax=Phaenicophaeus curvirostris TaxID=33595 RepID=UPI0037F0F367
MEVVQSRFLHLLQPIRDLSKNWEVDVAAQLEEYLEELEHVTISFDNGKTTMNFIEAALLIQGSACVYSKKVEYLYMLVYQTLDFISNKKRQKQPCSVGEDGKDVDATFRSEREEFLSLDDIGDSSQENVDLKKDHQPNAVDIVPLTPMSLVPPEEDEKRDNPLLSRKGELLASRKDFRMNTCTPHATGAFLLELAGLSPTFPLEPRCPGSPRRAPGAPSCGLGADPVQALSFSEDAGATEPEDDNCGGDNVPGIPENDVEMIPAARKHVEAQRMALRERRFLLRERAQDPNAHIKMLDPWQSLDPFHDSEEKPFKKGRPFVLPHGLDDVVGGKRKRKGPRKLQDFPKWFAAAYNNVADTHKTRRKGPTFADLESLYWQQLRARLASQRKNRGGFPFQAAPWVPLPQEEPEPLEEAREADGEDGADDFVEHEDLPPEGPEEPGAEVALRPGPEESLGYEELVRRNVELFMAESQKYARETELSQHVQRWEERMGPLLHEQEQRGPFDIHAYGETVAGACAALGRWRPFAALVAGKPAFEVCRYMLASLQLANEYVVELAQAPGLEEAVDTLRLRLLTQQRPRERFHTFQPTSASHGAPKPSE